MQTWKKKQDTIKHYNNQAKIYDIQYHHEQKNKIDKIINEIHFQKNSIILDLGCGTGFLFSSLENKTNFLVGLDISKNSLMEAKKRITKASNINLILADGEYSPFPNDIFNLIFIITVVQNLFEPIKLLIEIQRIIFEARIFASLTDNMHHLYHITACG